MKALEILKHKWISGNVIYDDETDTYIDDKLIEEAIIELEALQKCSLNRTCESCKFYIKGDGCGLTYWSDYMHGYAWECKDHDSCSRHEPKDKQ